MESRTERFRAKSLECLHAAQHATDHQAKASLLELAERWRELADQVEHLDRERPKP
jgi:ribosomal protein S15P/S13E